MAESLIPTGGQKLWSVSNIRGFVILSLFLQLLLASIAPLRKKSNNGFLVLLIHLGGPDMIMAFSLEDNALWMRHLVGPVVQLFTFFYIFLKTLPGNNLVVPTILIAVAGAIKYGERTRALYLASMETLKKSIEKPLDTSLDNPDDNYIADLKTKEAFDFFQIFKGLVVDIMPNHKERLWSREFIQGKDALEAFDMMETELGLLYDMFYTKILATNSAWGILARTIALYNFLAALVLYCLSKKEGFHEVDVWITFFLLASVVTLETFSGVMVVISGWSNEGRWYHYTCVAAQGLCVIIPGLVVTLVLFLFQFLFRGLIFKPWRKKLGAFNLISRCFQQGRQGDNRLKEYAAGTISRFFTAYRQRSSWNAFNHKIQNFIFNELNRMALFAEEADKVKTIFETRGGWILMESENNCELMRYVRHFDYDRSLLVWHIATEICYNNDGAINVAERGHRKLAKKLSDYMYYLLIKKPEMMSVVAGIGHIRYRDTCTEITHFCRGFESETVIEFCTRVVDEITSTEPAHKYKNKGASVLSDACNLAKALG